MAGYIRRATQDSRLPPGVGRRRLTLGVDGNGRTVSLAVRGRNVLIAGDTKSGKSWVTGLICEQLIQQQYSISIIDPEGDYSGLEALPGVIRIGGTSTGPTPRDIRTALRYPDVNVVIDLSQMPHVEKWNYAGLLLAGIDESRRSHGIPHRVVVDEAHDLLPDCVAQLDCQLAGYTLVTYKPSRLHPDLLRAAEAVVVTRLSDLGTFGAWCLLSTDTTIWLRMPSSKSGKPRFCR